MEHHLGLMMASPDLPDLNGLKYIVDDGSDDLCDILNAIEHAVDRHTTNLPQEKQVKDVNWLAKLVIAELRAWAKTKSKEDSIVEFREMLEGLKFKQNQRESYEV